jgi:hypothetical protein
MVYAKGKKGDVRQDMTYCKTSKGMLNRLDKIVFDKDTLLNLKCRECDSCIMYSNWYIGESMKKLLEMNPECEECGAELI